MQPGCPARPPAVGTAAGRRAELSPGTWRSLIAAVRCSAERVPPVCTQPHAGCPPPRGQGSESTCSPLPVMLDNRHQPGPYQSPAFIAIHLAIHSVSTYQPPAAINAVMVACKLSLACEGETAMAQSESPVQEAGGRNKEVQPSQPPVLPFVIPLGWREGTHLDFLSQAWAGMTPYAEPVVAISEEERLMPLGRKSVLQTKPCIIFYFPLKGGER